MIKTLFDRNINPKVFSHWQHCVAFGLGSGLARQAPGTCGTLAAMPFCVFLWWMLPSWALASVLLLMLLVGVWLCDGVARDLGVHDHSGIVWDEWVGYGIALFALPLQWYWPILAFVLFRFFDVLKPWPISWCDKKIHGGLGIMLDDVLAGILACLCLHGLSVLMPSMVVVDHAEMNKKPMNFIVILLDDLGLHDTGFMGNQFIETPAMDQLARDGVVFTQAYANAPNCAPSRAAIVSGQYAPRTGVYTMGTGDMGEAAQRKLLTPKNSMVLPDRSYSIANLLRDHGYVTASIGKWNLGHGPVRGPEGHGFDVNIAGHRGGVGQSYFAPYSTQLPGLQEAPVGEYLTDRLNAEAVQFVHQQRDKPFFIYLAQYAPHFPIQAPQKTKQKYLDKRKKFCSGQSVPLYCAMSDYYPEYAAMVEHIDRGVAQLREQLRRDGLENNTTIVLMSDNGGYPFVQESAALRGQKSDLYEGGIRVPMVWFVPGDKAGAVSDVPVSGVDIFPTIAALAGIDTKKQQLDGLDISSLIFRGQPSFSARDIFWYLPGYTLDSDAQHRSEDEATSLGDQASFSQIPAVAMRRGDWKLIWYYDGTPPELYNLHDDPLEARNLFSEEKKQGEEMVAGLKQWLQKVGGELQLSPNPAYRGH